MVMLKDEYGKVLLRVRFRHVVRTIEHHALLTCIMTSKKSWSKGEVRV